MRRPSPPGTAVAIVGIGCRFPGGVCDAASFWRLLTEGRDAIGEIPADRIDLAHYFDERPATPGRIMTRWGGFVGKVEDFDAMFFGIAPRDAERLDPQQRLLLETAWESLEDAGIDALALDGSNAAVFMGQWTSDFENRLFADVEAVDFPMTLGSGRYGAAARLSYVLGLRGPSLSIDAACSSGLACVHLAVQSLRQGECRLALAGATNLILQPHIHIAYSQSRMMAPDGHCKFGDASGDGYVRSEGVAVLVLKPLEAALRDGDRVHAVIHGSAVNNDGRSSGSMGRPSRIGQVELLRQAYADAGVPASAVGYVEAHGTGTRAGDPVELSALAEVLSQGRAADARAWVGSVKTNIGHTEATAGIAGLIKAVLVLQHDLVPPSLHHVQPNPNIPWADLPVAIPLQAQPLPVPAGRRLAGVSAYGIGGTNAHVVLEAADAPVFGPPDIDDGASHLLPLSARSDTALHELARRHADALASGKKPGLSQWCAAAAQRRSALEHRATFVAQGRDAMVETLRAFADGTAPAGAEGRVHDTKPPGIVFVVPGQGAQWPGMARELMHRSATFRADLQACDLAMRPWADWSLVEGLEAGSAFERIDQVQPALVALAIAYARWLEAHGIRPSAVVGHSMGEVAAAYIAGVLSLEQTMRIVCRRSQLMSRTSGQGAMALVDLSMAEAESRVAAQTGALGVAVNNSPRSCVVSGAPEAVHRLMSTLTDGGVFCRLVKVDVASHSPQMQPLADELVAELADLRPAEPRLPIYSTVNARREDGAVFDGAYWGRNLRQPVRFRESIDAALADGHTVFVELSPHAVLSIAIQQNAQAAQREAAVVACGQRDQADSAVLLGMVGALWTLGVQPDWAALQGSRARHVDLPLYPWQRERHWVREAAPAGMRRQSAERPARLDAGQWEWLHALHWIEATPLAPAALPASRRKLLLVGPVTEDDAALWQQAFDAEHADLLQCCASLEQAVQALHAPADRPDALVLLGGAGIEHPYDVLDLLRPLAAADAPGQRVTQLFFASCGAQAVDGHGRERVAVEQAALWGLGRVLAEEHPDLWGGLIDLDPSAKTTDRAAQLAAQVCRGGAEHQVAWRDGQRFALRLQALASQADGQDGPSWPAHGAWLVTGGLGDVALHLAASMVAQGVRRLVLVGRSALPPRAQWQTTPATSREGRRIAAVRALEAAGASVHLLVADLADPGDLERALNRYASEAWPPIIGVLHAAGVLETGLATQITRASFYRVYAPKVAGALALDRLLPEVERFVMISSLSATLGIAGMGSYAAANAVLDALAHDRRARGRHGLSIQSGAWIETGMHSGESADRNLRQLQDMGIQGHSPAQGVALFNELARRTEASVTVLPIDWTAFQAAKRGRDLTTFHGRGPIGDSAESGGDTLAKRLAEAADPAERRRLVEPVVREAIGKTLKLNPARVDPRKPLGAMGLNSLMAMELRNRLEAALGRALSATLAWNYPTLDSLVAFLCGEATACAAGPAASVPAAPAPGAVDSAAGSIGAVAKISNEDAARLLRRKR